MFSSFPPNSIAVAKNLLFPQYDAVYIFRKMKKYLSLNLSCSCESQGGEGKGVDSQRTSGSIWRYLWLSHLVGVGREDVTGIYWVEVRNSVRHPTVHRIIFKTSNDPSPDFNCSEVEIRPVGRNVSKMTNNFFSCTKLELHNPK